MRYWPPSQHTTSPLEEVAVNPSGRVILLASLLAMAISASCEPQPETDVPRELRTAIDAFYATIEAGDVEARIAMFSDDAIIMPNHWQRIEGKDSIAEMFRASADWVFRLRDREILDIGASGNLAYTVNAYDYTYHRQGDEPQWHKTKNVHIWKRDNENRWKLHVDIWNSDVRIDEFANE
jgi:ketosteroid isomerase-like protein